MLHSTKIIQLSVQSSLQSKCIQCIILLCFSCIRIINLLRLLSVVTSIQSDPIHRYIDLIKVLKVNLKLIGFFLGFFSWFVDFVRVCVHLNSYNFAIHCSASHQNFHGIPANISVM